MPIFIQANSDAGDKAEGEVGQDGSFQSQTETRLWSSEFQQSETEIQQVFPTEQDLQALPLTQIESYCWNVK